VKNNIGFQIAHLMHLPCPANSQSFSNSRLIAEKNGFIRTTGRVDNLPMTLTTHRIQLLAKLLDAATLRQNVIAQNVANVNTPGFSTLEVSFEDALKNALSSASSTQELNVPMEVIPGTGGIPRADGNNVDIDQEMARLQKNNIYFQVYAQMMTNELAQFRSAIRGQ
jgi:flagellar basal-body rod protein FlgB